MEAGPVLWGQDLCYWARTWVMGEGPVLIMPIAGDLIENSAFVKLEGDFYFIGILRNAFPNTQEQIAHLTKLNEQLYQFALTLNGKRYPCDSLAYPKTAIEWEAHFGDKWCFVREGKAKYDPNHRLKSLLTMHQASF